MKEMKNISKQFIKMGGKDFNEYMVKCMHEWFKTHTPNKLPSRKEAEGK